MVLPQLGIAARIYFSRMEITRVLPDRNATLRSQLTAE
jgi:hypothetical protein